MHEEVYTIKVTNTVSHLIFEGLDLLQKSNKWKDSQVDSLIPILKEQFRNLSNRKVAEVTEVYMLNPFSIDVLKRQKYKSEVRDS